MRITVCELPSEPAALEAAWSRLCEHSWRAESELVLLPEFSMVDAVWEGEHFDPVRWAIAENVSNRWMGLLGELHAGLVIGTRPASVNGARYNEGFIWSAASGTQALRRKYFLPNEPGGWEARWFDRGDASFPVFRAGKLSFGLNVCSELWALETYQAYAEQGAGVILSPRATARATRTKWLAAGTVAAVRSGGYSVSSNRVDPNGVYGGGGWVISPRGEMLALTSEETPFATVDIDLAEPARAQDYYPGYLFRESGARV